MQSREELALELAKTKTELEKAKKKLTSIKAKVEKIIENIKLEV